MARRPEAELMDANWIAIAASVLLQSSPLIIAVCGETLSERAGVVNLSLDGSLLLSALAGFVAAYFSSSLLLGFLAAAGVGALMALIVAFGSLALRQSQVAVGFVLTLLGDSLSAFLGQNFTRLPGPWVQRLPIPLLKDIPVLGPIFFNQDLVVYFSLVLVAVTTWWIFHTRPGLELRSAGERPEAAFARGVAVRRLRYWYAVLGGALVGIAGAAYSLDVKIGWAEGHTRGLGWIALAIVIFGGWSPLRGALGVLLFVATRSVISVVLQRSLGESSVVILNALPWLLMLGVLVVVGGRFSEQVLSRLPAALQRPFRGLLRAAPPAALGAELKEG
ncbi:MAG: ABC transporter permease [Anaerolineales bacterium]|nr:ABC transporter permease [Anaerolineales bacterium]